MSVNSIIFMMESLLLMLVTSSKINQRHAGGESLYLQNIVGSLETVWVM